MPSCMHYALHLDCAESLASCVSRCLTPVMDLWLISMATTLVDVWDSCNIIKHKDITARISKMADIRTRTSKMTKQARES